MYIEETNHLTGEKRTYEVVEKITNGYSIWNIGGIDDQPNYLPLCICYSGTYSVQMDKLLAIKIPTDEQRIMSLCSMRTGCGNLYKVRTRLERNNLSPYNRNLLKKALPLFEKYTK